MDSEGHADHGGPENYDTSDPDNNDSNTSSR